MHFLAYFFLCYITIIIFFLKLFPKIFFVFFLCNARHVTRSLWSWCWSYFHLAHFEVLKWQLSCGPHKEYQFLYTYIDWLKLGQLWLKQIVKCAIVMPIHIPVWQLLLTSALFYHPPPLQDNLAAVQAACNWMVNRLAVCGNWFCGFSIYI